MVDQNNPPKRIILLQIKQPDKYSHIPFGSISLASSLPNDLCMLYQIECPDYDPNNYLDNELNTYDEFKSFFKLLYSSPPDILCISVFDIQIPLIQLLVSHIKKIYTGLIAIGGPSATLYPEELIDLIDCHLVIRGEGELVLPAIIKAFDTTLPEKAFIEKLQKLKGVIYRSQTGEITECKTEEINTLTDEELNKVNINWNFCRDQYLIALQTSRGCPRDCSFCSPYIQKKWRKLSVERLIDHLHQIINSNKLIRSNKKILLNFSDDTFLLEKKRAIKFFTLYQKEKLYNHFDLCLQTGILDFFNNDSINHELLEAMSTCNIFSLSMGADAFNNSDLKLYRKGYDIEKVFELAYYLKKYNLYSIMYCIFANHLSTPQSFLENLINTQKLIEIMDKDFRPSFINQIYPNPNTPIYEDVLSRKWEHLIKSYELKLSNGKSFIIPTNVVPYNKEAKKIFKNLTFNQELVFLKDQYQDNSYDSFKKQLPNLIKYVKKFI